LYNNGPGRLSKVIISFRVINPLPFSIGNFDELSTYKGGLGRIKGTHICLY